MISIFLVELYLDNVLDVLLVVSTKLVYKYQRMIHWKKYDGWFINDNEVFDFSTFPKKKNIEVWATINGWDIQLSMARP